MTTPRLGAPELTSGQAAPETTVNEQIRYVEQGASRFVFKDRDLSTPPGSPADGDCYLVKATGTGAWAGKDGKIAFYENTSWVFITAKEGFRAYVNDEDIEIVFDGSSWSNAGSSLAVPAEWAPNFTSSGDLYIPAVVAMTIDQGNAAIGTATITFSKSTAAAPSTFSSTSLPATLQAGAWLKVSAASVVGFAATHLKRTA
jgi:hypothetical protein